MAGSSRTDLCDLNQQRQCFAGSSVEASTACSRQQGLALRSRLRFAIIALLACLVAATAFFFFYVCVWRCFVSVDGLCPEEGFKGVWVSRGIVVVVLVGL